MAKSKYTEVDEEILENLDELGKTKQHSQYTQCQERIIAGFEDIQRFFEEHGRTPVHGEDRDIFERLYAVRLDRLIAQEKSRELLEGFDHYDLLSRHQTGKNAELGDLDDDEILDHFVDEVDASDIATIKHVRPYVERQSPDEVAVRKRCDDFGEFKQMFDQIQNDLRNGTRRTRRFKGKAQIEEGTYFVVGGLIAYVAKRERDFKSDHGEFDARLRVIFSNGTESNLLMRSLQRSLRQDGAGRRITDPKLGPIFDDDAKDRDKPTGYVYVLRSLSENENVKKYRSVLHKIGVTNDSVEKRIQNAKSDPTYLCAEVKVVLTLKIYNIAPMIVEQRLHQIFERTRCNFKVKDEEGKYVNPREWFLVTDVLIKEAVGRIIDNSIDHYIFVPEQMRFVRKSDA